MHLCSVAPPDLFQMQHVAVSSMLACSLAYILGSSLPCRPSVNPAGSPLLQPGRVLMVCPAGSSAETSSCCFSSLWTSTSCSFVLTRWILRGNASEADDGFIGRAAFGDLRMSSGPPPAGPQLPVSGSCLSSAAEGRPR